MAERRMFAKRIIDSDAFTELPPTTQALYFHLCMGADDDGFNNQIRRGMFNAHADRNDFDMLIQKRFIIPFESGVIVIKHWRMHNLIKSDRYKHTAYIDEMAAIILKENGVYVESETEPKRNPSGTQVEPKRNPSGTQTEPQYRLGKDRLGKYRLSKDKIAALLSESSLSEPVRKTVLDFLAYREEIKKPYTSERSIKSLITQIEKQEQAIGSIAVIRVIDTSMQNGWQGLFWDKTPKPQNTATDMAEIARMMDEGVL